MPETELYSALHRKRPVEEVFAILGQRPDAARVVRRELEDAHGDAESETRVGGGRMTKAPPEDYGWLPLHYASRYSVDVPIQILQALLDAHRAGAESRDANGCLPLHLAMRESSAEVVHALLEAYRPGAEAKTSNGWLPIHHAMNPSGSVEVARLLLDAYPAGAEAETQGGRLPLHIAVQNQAPGQVVQLLLDVHPAAAQMPDSNGLLPLHAAASFGASAAVVQALLAAHPAGATTKIASSGWLPLHSAVNSWAPFSIVRLLVDAYPAGKEVRTHRGDLPVNILSCQSRRPDLAEIMPLLELVAKAATPAIPAKGQRRRTASVGAPVTRRQSRSRISVSGILEDEGEKVLQPVPAPPDSISWDWPLSRYEKKARVQLLERQMHAMDRKALLQVLRHGPVSCADSDSEGEE